VSLGGKPHLIVPYSLANNDGKFARGAFATANDWFAFTRDPSISCTRRGRVSRE
jgi:allantoinase